MRPAEGLIFFALRVADIFDKAVTIGMGRCPVKKYNEYLRDLFIQGKTHPGKIVSHHIGIQDAPDAVDGERHPCNWDAPGAHPNQERRKTRVRVTTRATRAARRHAGRDPANHGFLPKERSDEGVFRQSG
jgi:hypothetical protein